MSSLTLITGTIDEAEDPFMKLDINELYYEKWDESYEDPDSIIVSREPLPIRFFGKDQFRISQYLGSGKTLKGMDILAHKVFHGGNVCANLGLVWDNIGKPKEEWTSGIQSLDDFKSLSHCTALLDDVKGTILRWNSKEAEFIAEIMNAGRKLNLDIIITAQREKQIPPDIRDIATDWIVPIIRVRDYTRETPDNTGYPIEMISLHFDGGKVFKFMSDPIICLDPLFDSYSTLQRATVLRQGEDTNKNNQPGAKEEEKLYNYCKSLHPEINMKLGNGKGQMDIETDVAFIDHKGISHNGKSSRLNMKNGVGDHRDYCELRGVNGWVSYLWRNEYRFIKITSKHLRSHNPTITPALLAASRSHKAVFG